MLILLVSSARDLTTDYIVRELRRRDIEAVRLNTEDLPSGRVWFCSDSGEWRLSLRGKDIVLSDVRSAYYRRPALPLPSVGGLGVAERSYVVAEWSAVLKSLYAVIGRRWLNAPSSIDAAEDKPRQLAAAMFVGFSVPPTLITNDPDAASTFVGEGAAVAKPLRRALLEGDGRDRVIFTSRVEVEFLNMQREAISVAPVILQREIQKRVDIRATVVGNHVFAAEIHSQEEEETIVDWRRGARPDLRHEIHALPSSVSKACVDLTNHLGLRFGAIDLVQDLDGRYWFLEINPNGQWAWIENRTELPISSAIVDELVLISSVM